MPLDKNVVRNDVHKILDHKWLDPVCVERGCQSLYLEDRVEGLEAALIKVRQWGEAYPLDVFPEPDMMKARELLKAGGVTLDAVAASIVRRTIERVAHIARDALDQPTNHRTGS